MRFDFPFRVVPRKATKHTRNGHSYKDPESARFEKQAKEYAKLQAGDLTPRSGQLRAVYRFYFKKPKGTKFKYPPRPDTDNCVKGLADALQGVVFLNDSQITKIDAEKEWADHDHFFVIIEELG